MRNKYFELLPSDFPIEFLELAKDLSQIGINELAWDGRTSIKVIDFLSENDFFVLGGDVYKVDDGILMPTIDSWYTILELPSIVSDKLIEEAKIKSTEYINRFIERNGNSYYYTIIFRKL